MMNRRSSIKFLNMIYIWTITSFKLISSYVELVTLQNCCDNFHANQYSIGHRVNNGVTCFHSNSFVLLPTLSSRLSQSHPASFSRNRNTTGTPVNHNMVRLKAIFGVAGLPHRTFNMTQWVQNFTVRFIKIALIMVTIWHCSQGWPNQHNFILQPDTQNPQVPLPAAMIIIKWVSLINVKHELQKLLLGLTCFYYFAGATQPTKNCSRT